MSRINLIEKELVAINEAKFQMICTAFLASEYRGDLQNSGKVEGKEKTRKGTPDAYIIQKDNTYILAEFTTRDKTKDAGKFFKKLELDLRKCLAFESLSINPEKVAAIVLCFNSKISPAENEALQRISASFNISLRLIGIDMLAKFLDTQGQFYAHSYLNIPIKSGQILSKNDFLKQYSKQNLATPLDNQFIDRASEQTSLIGKIENNDIVIVSGNAGVGKSRLCLQVIDDYLARHTDCIAYYVMRKVGSITEELWGFLDEGKEYVFFVDDANNQIQNLLSIIYLSHESAGKKIKVIATVRGYVKDKVLEACKQFRYEHYCLRKLSRKSIINIISGRSFQVDNSFFASAIADISAGNPRLAIMAARVIIQSKDIGSLKNVSTIYDEYFHNIIDDHRVFQDKETMKVIGLISYFYNVEFNSENFNEALKRFNIQYERFTEIVKVLEELELVEIYYDSIVEISEQVLATYLFYKVFIVDRCLSFETLLSFAYDQKLNESMRDAIGSIYASFGEQNALNNIKTTVLDYFATINNDHEKAAKFLQVFGLSIPDQTFLFVKRYMDQAEKDNTFYDPVLNDKFDRMSVTSFPVLKILIPFFRSENIQLLTVSIQLALKYINIYPVAVGALTTQLGMKFWLTYPDLFNKFIRQKTVYSILLRSKLTADLKDSFFFSLFNGIILVKLPKRIFYTREENGWKLSESAGDLRISFWKDIDRLFERYPVPCERVIDHYIQYLPGTSRMIMEVEESYVCDIMLKHLNPELFHHCYLVYKYLDILDCYYAPTERLDKLRRIYLNPAVVLFCKLSSSYPFARKAVDSEDTTEEIGDMKIDSIEQFEHTYTLLLESVPFWNKINWAKSNLDKLILGVFKKNFDLGLNIIEHLIKDGNRLSVHPLGLFNLAFSMRPDFHDGFFTLMKSCSFRESEAWFASYLMAVPKEYADEHMMNETLSFYANAGELGLISSDSLSKFIHLDSNINERLLLVIANRIDNGDNFEFDFHYNFITENPILVEDNFQICKRIYFYKKNRNKGYDSVNSHLFNILFQIDRDFILEYINFLDENKLIDNSDNQVDIPEHILDYPDILEKVLIRLKSIKVHRYRPHFSSKFLAYLNAKSKRKLFNFLKKMISRYREDPQMLDVIFDISKFRIKDKTTNLFKYFLTVNNDFTVFERIQWNIVRQEKYEDAIPIEYSLDELNNYYKIISSFSEQTQLVEHKEYLMRRIFELQGEIYEEKKYRYWEYDFYRDRNKKKYLE